MNRTFVIFIIIFFLISLFLVSSRGLDIITGRVTLGTSATTTTIETKEIIEYEEPDCYSVDGVSFSNIPNQTQLEYIAMIKPRVFGIITFFPDLERIGWINDLDPAQVGYEFKKFYGSTQFQNLIDLKSEFTNIDIIGYCPLIGFEPLEEATLSDRIDLLKTTYPDKEILIGPCIDLFDKVKGSVNKPDYLGFELLERDFDNYLYGNYDDIINEILSQRVDINAYIAIGKNTDLEKLKKVLNKVSSNNLDIGYMIDGDERILDFILEKQCK